MAEDYPNLPGVSDAELTTLEQQALDGHRQGELDSYKAQIQVHLDQGGSIMEMRGPLLGFFREIYPDREPPEDTAELWYLVNNHFIEKERY